MLLYFHRSHTRRFLILWPATGFTCSTIAFFFSAPVMIDVHLFVNYIHLKAISILVVSIAKRRKTKKKTCSWFYVDTERRWFFASSLLLFAVQSTPLIVFYWNLGRLFFSPPAMHWYRLCVYILRVSSSDGGDPVYAIGLPLLPPISLPLASPCTLVVRPSLILFILSFPLPFPLVPEAWKIKRETSPNKVAREMRRKGFTVLLFRDTRIHVSSFFPSSPFPSHPFSQLLFSAYHWRIIFMSLFSVSLDVRHQSVEQQLILLVRPLLFPQFSLFTQSKWPNLFPFHPFTTTRFKKRKQPAERREKTDQRGRQSAWAPSRQVFLLDNDRHHSHNHFSRFPLRCIGSREGEAREEKTSSKRM